MDSSFFQGNLVESCRILYTPSIFAKTSLIHLQEIGESQARKPHISKRKNLSSYLFFIIMSGSGQFEYAGHSHAITSGDCVFIDCHKAYSHYTSEDLWKLKWVHFYGPSMNNIYQKYTERGGLPCFHPKETEGYIKLLSQLHEIASSADYIRDMHIHEKLSALLTLLMEESWHPEINAHHSAKKQNIQSIKDYLDQNYAKKIILDDLSERFYINKFYLTRIFKEQFGVSINNYILQVRNTHAKQLLRFTDLTIEAIGVECGMCDANYFSRMFKKIEGISPGEYRKIW